MSGEPEHAAGPPVTRARPAPPDKPVAWLRIQMLLDSAAWVVALVLALVLRYEMALQFISVPGLLLVSAVAVAAQLVVGFSFALYKGRYSFAASTRPSCSGW